MQADPGLIKCPKWNETCVSGITVLTSHNHTNLYGRTSRQKRVTVFQNLVSQLHFSDPRIRKLQLRYKVLT